MWSLERETFFIFILGDSKGLKQVATAKAAITQILDVNFFNAFAKESRLDHFARKEGQAFGVKSNILSRLVDFVMIVCDLYIKFPRLTGNL